MFPIQCIFVFDKLDFDLGGGGQAVSKVLVTQMLQTVDAKNHSSLVIIIIRSKIKILQFFISKKTSSMLRDFIVNSIIIKNFKIGGNHNCQNQFLWPAMTSRNTYICPLPSWHNLRKADKRLVRICFFNFIGFFDALKCVNCKEGHPQISILNPQSSVLDLVFSLQYCYMFSL